MDNNYGYLIKNNVISNQSRNRSEEEIKIIMEQEVQKQVNNDRSSSDNSSTITDESKELSEISNAETGLSEFMSATNDQQTSESETTINSKTQSESVSSVEEQVLNRATKQYLHGDEMKFMENFDPSERLSKKKSRKFTDEADVIEVEDDKGIDNDECDCLVSGCPGCHFMPCPSCGSKMCGIPCRKGRTWNYEEVEVQGYNIKRICNPSRCKKQKTTAVSVAVNDDD